MLYRRRRQPIAGPVPPENCFPFDSPVYGLILIAPAGKAMVDRDSGPHLSTSKPSGKRRHGRNGRILISVTDPTGYHITLDVQCWEKHIIVQHPEIRTRLDDVRATLEHPEIIQRVLDGEHTYYYYRLSGRSFYRFKDVYLLVVVERDDGTRAGFVKTAHLVPKMRARGGQIIWLGRK